MAAAAESIGSGAAASATDDAVFRIFINGPVEAVWREITRTDVPQKCFFNMRMHTVPSGLKPGAPMQMRTKSGKYVGAIGEVLEFDPPRRYSHTFRFTHLNDPPCVVTYDLKPMNGGTEFTMTLSNLPKGTKTAAQMTQGGNMIINTLKRVVETGKPSVPIRILYVLFGVLEPLTGKKVMRVENWPLE